MQRKYKLENIILLESSFKREVEISYESDEFKSNINIETGYQIENNNLYVIVGINFYAGTISAKQIVVSVKMLGSFLILNKKGQIPVKQFAKINAPAIIFPFIREHVATLSLKAGIRPILLQPVNFVKLAKQSDKTVL